MSKIPECCGVPMHMPRYCDYECQQCGREMSHMAQPPCAVCGGDLDAFTSYRTIAKTGPAEIVTCLAEACLARARALLDEAGLDPDPPPKRYDGLCAAECLLRWQALQRDEGCLYNRDNKTRIVLNGRWNDGHELTPAQLAAARELWSAVLRAKVEASAERDQQREPRVLVEIDEP